MFGRRRPGVAVGLTTPRLRRLAPETFRFEELHPGQEEAIRGRSTRRNAWVLPADAGKLGHLPAGRSHHPRPTVVVSPLMALQRDQLAALLANRGRRRRRNSQVRAAEHGLAFDDLVAGDLES